MRTISGPAPAERPVLLVVDDQPSNIAILYDIFKQECEVCMATSGAAALDFCATRTPDLILLDIVMPDMHGFAVCAALKADSATADIPIIFVTGKNDPLNEARALDEGGSDFISKPFAATVVKARVRVHLLLRIQAQALRQLALSDALTGLANRRNFDDTLAAEWRRCSRSGAELALLMVDVDHFKAFNDSYGHQAGDRCLQAIAAVLDQTLSRSHDLAARYGGEEFACILPETGFDGALRVAEQLLAAVAALHIVHAGAPTQQLSVSIGMAVLRPRRELAFAALIDQADQQLYLAKAAGRGRVCAAGVAP